MKRTAVSPLRRRQTLIRAPRESAVLHHVAWHIVPQYRTPNAFEQDPLDGLAAHLLVQRHGRLDSRAINVLTSNRQVEPLQQPPLPFHDVGGQAVPIAQLMPRREHHPDCDSLAVEEAPVCRRRLESVREGVAVVQSRPHTRLFALVLADNARLDRHAAPDRLCRGLAIELEDRLGVLLEKRQQSFVSDEGVLDDLCPAGEVLAGRQRPQGRHVGDHHARLVERADHVLRARMIDADLAADRSVDHGEQAGGRVDQRYAAGVGRCDEAREVGDHPAAEGDNRLPAFGFQADQANRRCRTLSGGTSWPRRGERVDV